MPIRGPQCKAILVVWSDGDEEYLCEGLTDRPAMFPGRAAAQRHVDFMMIGMDGEVESIDIVPYPKLKKEV